MSEGAFPNIIELHRLDSGEAHFQGTLPLASFARLAEMLVGSEGDVSAELNVLMDQDGQVTVHGSVDAELPMQCQRCLEAVRVRVTADYHLVVADSDGEAERYGRESEPVVAPAGRLDAKSMLEDELILALPVVAMHEGDERCGDRRQHFGPPGEAEPEKENPFAVLARLKDKEQD